MLMKLKKILVLEKEIKHSNYINDKDKIIFNKIRFQVKLEDHLLNN